MQALMKVIPLNATIVSCILLFHITDNIDTVSVQTSEVEESPVPLKERLAYVYGNSTKKSAEHMKSLKMAVF
jgi:hypothetical protein